MKAGPSFGGRMLPVQRTFNTNKEASELEGKRSTVSDSPGGNRLRHRLEKSGDRARFLLFLLRPAVGLIREAVRQRQRSSFLARPEPADQAQTLCKRSALGSAVVSMWANRTAAWGQRSPLLDFFFSSFFLRQHFCGCGEALDNKNKTKP